MRPFVHGGQAGGRAEEDKGGPEGKPGRSPADMLEKTPLAQRGGRVRLPRIWGQAQGWPSKGLPFVPRGGIDFKQT